MTTVFAPALAKVLRHEGVQLDAAGQPAPGHTGYVNHPDDPGGETNYGVTVAEARRWGWTGPMRELPWSLVQTIYETNYWRRLGCQQMSDQGIAEELFDTGVNCGTKTVGEFLQRTLNVLNKKGTLYPDVAVDGVVGPKTVAALEAALRVAPWYRSAILRALDSLQCVYYITLAEHDQKFETFMPGWLRTRVGGY